MRVQIVLVATSNGDLLSAFANRVWRSSDRPET
jgi:hypothetical protein